MTKTDLTLLDIQIVLDLPDSLSQRVMSLLAASSRDANGAPHSRVDIVAYQDSEGIHLTGGGSLVTVRDESAALATLLSWINILVLGAAPYLGIHAGVVASAQQAVAFPAASGIGKSTLVTACLQAGMSYVSDEALCLNWTTGAIVEYPRPIGLSADSCRLLGLTLDGPRETAWSAAMLGAATATAPLRLAHVVLLDDSTSTLESISRGAGAAELLTRSFNHWHHPDRAFELVHEIVQKAQVWRMGRAAPGLSAARIASLTSVD